ncbi:MAG: DUF2807 domain-containing protein [Bacteroidota bacterium]
MNLKIWLLNLALVAVFSLSAQNNMASVTDIEIDGPVVVKLISGSETSIRATKEADLVSWEVNGNALVVIARYQKRRDTPEIEISIKELEALATTGSVVLEGQGEFATRRMQVQAGSQSIVSLDVDTEILIASAKAQSILNLSGNADDFRLSVDTQSVANAEELNSAQIKVSADHQSVANINSDGATVNSEARNQSVVLEQ